MLDPYTEPPQAPVLCQFDNENNLSTMRPGLNGPVFMHASPIKINSQFDSNCPIKLHRTVNTSKYQSLIQIQNFYFQQTDQFYTLKNGHNAHHQF